MTTVEHLDQKVGVWVEDGVIYSRHEKDYSPKSHTPKNPQDEAAFQRALELVRGLYSDAEIPSWSASMEAAHDQNFEELKTLVDF